MIFDLIKRLGCFREGRVLVSLGESYFNLSIFMTSQGKPVVKLREMDLEGNSKTADILIRELENWMRKSDHAKNKSPLYCVLDYEYEDGSYDLRYYRIKGVDNQSGCNVLLADETELVELREHYEASD